MTNKIRKQVIKEQNKCRSQVAKGKVVNGTFGTKLSKASDMFQLVYSKKLEKKALKLAKTCQISIVKGATFSQQPVGVKTGNQKDHVH